MQRAGVGEMYEVVFAHKMQLIRKPSSQKRNMRGDGRDEAVVEMIRARWLPIERSGGFLRGARVCCSNCRRRVSDFMHNSILNLSTKAKLKFPEMSYRHGPLVPGVVVRRLCFDSGFGMRSTRICFGATSSRILHKWFCKIFFKVTFR